MRGSEVATSEAKHDSRNSFSMERRNSIVREHDISLCVVIYLKNGNGMARNGTPPGKLTWRPSVNTSG